MPADLNTVETRVDLSARLLRTQGFIVETPAGDFGTVEAFRPGSRPGTPGFLLVRGGWRGRRRRMVSVVDIAAVLPRERRIRVRSTGMEIKA